MSEHDPSIGNDPEQKAPGLGLEPMEETPRKSARWPWLVLVVALAVAAAIGVWLYAELNRTEPETPVAQAPEPARRDYMDQIPVTPQAPEAAPAEPQAPAPAAEPQTGAKGPAGDEVVQADFVTDLALYAASRYHPAGTRDNDSKTGRSTLTFKSLNMRYGTELTGLSHEDKDLEAAREEIFTALMHPIILRVVFNLYADDFVAALAAEAQAQERDFKAGAGFETRHLSKAQASELLRITARQCRDTGAVFQAFAQRPELADSVTRYFDASARVNEAYAEFADAQAAGMDTKALDAAAEAIKQSIKERERLKEAVLAGLRTKNHGLSDGQTMDIATWITRRVRGHSERINSIGAIASLSTELADKLEAAAQDI